MERTNVKIVLLAFVTVFVLCAPDCQVCHASDVQAVVHPVRIITVTYTDDIVSVSSNTSQAVTPQVERIGVPGVKVRYTTSIKADYLRIIKRHDFSKPVELSIMTLSPLERFKNYIFNNIHPLFAPLSG